MAYKTKFIHFKTKASYEAERAKTTEGTEERKVFDAYISFVDEGPTMYVFGKEYQCDTNSVSYTSQELTDAEKTQARTNIGAASKDAETVIIDVRDIRNPSIEKYNLAKDAFISKKHVVLLSDDSSQLPVIQMFSETTVLDPIVMYTASLTTAEQDGSTGIFGWIYEFEASGNINYTDVTISPSDIEPQPAGTASAGESLDYARADHVHPAQTDITGNAATATMANGIYENNILWGNKNLTQSFSPFDCALIPELGANRFAFLKPAGVSLEYSIDGGKTWLEYPNSEEIIPCLFGMTLEYMFRIDPLNNKENITSLYKTRVTISCKTAAIYSSLNKIVFYVSTNGSSGCTVDVSSCTRNSDVFTDIATGFALSGWTGYNVFNQELALGDDTDDTRISKLRFTFNITSHNAKYNKGLSIIHIMAYGGVGWQTPSNLAKNGHLYAVTSDLSARFPAAVAASKFITRSGGNGQNVVAGDGSLITVNSLKQANKLSSTRIFSLTGAVTGTVTSDLSSNVSISTTLSNIDASKITTGTINAERLPEIPLSKIPAGALERLYVVDSETAALGLDIQEGDIVQIGSNGPMYFCISDTAMIFSAKFKPFTVGSAASVPWSGVTDKPTFASVATSGSYNDLSDKPSIPSLDGYATESWVTEQGYLTSIPVASADSVGGVKIGDNITLSLDTISLSGDNIISALGYTPASISDIPEIPTSLPNPQPLVLNGTSYYGNATKKFSFVPNLTALTLNNNTVRAGYAYTNTSITSVTGYSDFTVSKRSATIYSTQKITFSGSNIVKMKGLADLSGTYYIYCLELIDDTHIAINGAVYE